MRKLHIQLAQPGNVIAKTIHQENGNVLLGVGVELNARYIERLTNLGIDTIYIDDKNTMDIIPEDAISDETRKYAVDTVYSTMTRMIDQPKLANRVADQHLGSTFRKVFGDILSELMQRKDVLVTLTNLNVMDGYLFHHSVNVAILAGVLGMAKGYNQNQMYDLGVGALLFDIGMTKLPKEVLLKKGALSAEEAKIVGEHPVTGFDLLRARHDVSLMSAHCALQHHERYDGSGYHRGVAGDKIHEYAQIVGLADMYDALISPRSYRQRYAPNEASELLFAVGNKWFDIDLLRLFFKNIALYPIASTVMLNTGQVGVVSSIDPAASTRPTVRVIYEPNGVPPRSTYEIDLKRYLNLTIVKVL